MAYSGIYHKRLLEAYYSVQASATSPSPPLPTAALVEQAKALYSAFVGAPGAEDLDRINRMDRINSTTNPVNPVHPVQTSLSVDGKSYKID